MYRSLNFCLPTDPPRYLPPSVVISILVPKNTDSIFYEAHSLTTNQDLLDLADSRQLKIHLRKP